MLDSFLKDFRLPPIETKYLDTSNPLLESNMCGIKESSDFKTVLSISLVKLMI